MKVCRKCHIEKLESEFRRNRGWVCIECHEKLRHLHYLTSKNKVREYNPECKKVCIKCGEEKVAEHFRRNRNKDGLSNICSGCLNMYSRAYHNKNKSELNANRRLYRLNNPRKKERKQIYKPRIKIRREKKINQKCDWSSKESVRNYFRQWTKRGRDLLSDTYVLQQLMNTTKLPAKFFRKNKDLIELKRLEIKTKRLLKQKNKHHD